jgi:hydrogenase nickel incorporation protein HypA/HybF
LHEFGIASDIWQAVLRAARQHGGGRVRAITVEIGELNLIEDEQLRFWVGALAERDGSREVDLRITHLPVRVRCRQCGEENTAQLTGRAPGFFLPPTLACPRCGSHQVEAMGGRELLVVSAEIEPEAEDGSRG